MIRNAPRDAAVYGVDLGKNVFHVVGVDTSGAVIQRAKFRRDTLLAFFERAGRAIVGMEACPGSQWLARKLLAMGAEAIAEAVTRPTMRFTHVRTAEQTDLQALHRIRDQLVTSRTRLINQMRAFCLEYGVTIRQGAGLFRLDLPNVLADDNNDLTPAMRRMLSALREDLVRLDQRIVGVTREIEGLAARDDRARRLMTIPGIGPLAATALLAAVGDGRQFRRARDLAAWLGLVPREFSTGGKTTLLGISKRGNRYLRRLLVHGARSCVTHLDRARDRLGGWLDGLQARMHVNKVTVALAAKIARTAWVILTKPGALYERRDPAVA